MAKANVEHTQAEDVPPPIAHAAPATNVVLSSEDLARLIEDTGARRRHDSAGKVFLAVITALVTAILAVPATYYINDYLAREHVTIEAVEFQPLMTTFSIDDDTTYKMTADFDNDKSEFRIWVDQQPEKIQALFKDHDGPYAGDEFEKLKTSLIRLNEYLDSRLREVQQFQVRWQESPIAMDQNPDATTRPIDGSKQASPPLPPTRYRDMGRQWERFVNDAAMLRIIYDFNEVSPATMSDTISKKLQKLQDARGLFANVAKSATTFTSTRTGDTNLKITFLNSGSTDGIIRGRGYLVLDSNERIPIYAYADEHDDRDRKIEKRSMLNATWTLDNNRASPSDLNYVFALLKARADKSAMIELDDFRGNHVRSAPVKFPVADP